MARPGLRDVALQEPPLPPVFAFTKTPNWDDAEEETRLAFDEVAQALGEQVMPFNVPAIFGDAWQWHRDDHGGGSGAQLPRSYTSAGASA